MPNQRPDRMTLLNMAERGTPVRERVFGESLHFRNIEVGQVAHAVITIDFNYEEGAKGAFTPVVRDYTVEGLRSGKSKHAVDVQGLPGAPIINLRLTNCSFDNVAQPSIVRNVKDVTIDNVKVNGRTVDALV